jgi:tRNA threonylcarbamoyladenosine biosynthesis protein TsaB
MIVLGFDTATSATTVALRLPDGQVLQARDDPAPGERPRHSSLVLAFAHRLLGQAGLSWSEVGLIAVGRGPGTFTGLRIGVSTARALGQATGIRVVGVSTLRILAARVTAVAAQEAGVSPGAQTSSAEPEPPVLAVVDARRGEAFAAAYRGARQLVSPRAVAPQSLAGLVVSAGAPDSRWLAVGDGAVRFRTELEAGRVSVAPGDSSLHRVDAGTLCRLAAKESGPLDSPVLPTYLRPPDAEIALRRR